MDLLGELTDDEDVREIAGRFFNAKMSNVPTKAFSGSPRICLTYVFSSANFCFVRFFMFSYLFLSICLIRLSKNSFVKNGIIFFVIKLYIRYAVFTILFTFVPFPSS